MTSFNVRFIRSHPDHGQPSCDERVALSEQLEALGQAVLDTVDDLLCEPVRRSSATLDTLQRLLLLAKDVQQLG
jgi:hypothetical protein